MKAESSTRLTKKKGFVTVGSSISNHSRVQHSTATTITEIEDDSDSRSFTSTSTSTTTATLSSRDIEPSIEESARSTGLSPDSSNNNTLHLRASKALSSSSSSSSSSHKSKKKKPKRRKMAPLSPRSSSYERLEGGMGPSRTGGNKRRLFGWKKFGLAAAALILVVYFFGPRETGIKDWVKGKDGGYPYENEVDTDPLPGPPETVHKDQDRPAIPPSTTHDGDTKPLHPTSYETDPDPSKTTYCTAPHDPSARLVQYALMIDAGSTGSRIHIYKFNNCGSSPGYEYEVFKMTQPGLSSFAGKPEEAAQSLDILLDEAVRVVPKDLYACTPVAVKATAGLRLLPGSQSADILKAVEARLHSKYQFQIPAKDAVVVMDGKDEGVYAWITANYLLRTILPDTPKDTPTYAVLDLGGASTQIVFEPVFATDDKGLEEGEHKYDLDFGGKKHVLYQHSYLGYGLMRARMHVHRLVEFMATIRLSTGVKVPEGIVGNPCLAKGTRRIVQITDEVTKEVTKVTMDGEEIGSFEACDRVVQLVMAKDSICELKPCSFNGVYQPSLMSSFPSGKVLLLSYFYDRIAPLIPALSPPSPSSPSSPPPTSTKPALTVSTIAQLADTVCQGRGAWLEHWGTNAELMEELAGRPEWCLDLTFMHALLRLGYEFEDERDVVIGKQIAGTELGWCLGATIAMVGGELTCRA